jgi:kexin
MIVAYSSGSGEHIVTTDKGINECATTHGGTSAAAPNAVGVFALALEARPDLTWRDIQYLCIKTARIVNADDPDWEYTATGQLYSYKYGFGALDAWRFITAAKEWTVVKPQAWFKTHSIQLGNGSLNEQRQYNGGVPIPQQAEGEKGVKSTMTITQEMITAHNLESLEHINVRVWIKHARRGDVEVEIVSPNGVKSVLGAHRIKDLDKDGYPGWTFMSVKHWYMVF